MEVTCPACAARYTADDEKLRGKTARMRCRACDTVWLVSGPSSGEERRAAVARRGAPRERRDLFASRPPEDGSVRETLRPPPAGLVGGVAARNENSVLFKVDDVLAASHTARVKTPEPPATYASPAAPAGRDDSGIIDLKALAAAPPKVARPPVANLFGASEPPPAAFAREVSGASSSFPRAAGESKAASLFRRFGPIAAAAGVVLSCGIGVAVAFGGEDPPPKAATAAVMPLAPPAPEPAAAATAEPEPASAAATTAAADDDDATTSSPSKSKKKKKRRGAKGAKKSSGGLITNKSAPPPPKKVKPADPCGCHGDFNCILACAAGKKR